MAETGFEPGNPKPIGTLKELRAHRLSILQNGSCSEPSKNNRGCKFYNPENGPPCPVRQMMLRQQVKPPEFTVFVAVKPNGKMKQDAELCFDYMETKHNAPANVGTYDVIGFGGKTTIKVVESHPNPQDKKGLTRIRKVVAFAVPHMKRPGESMADLSTALEVREEILKRRRERLIEERMGMQEAEETPEEDKVADDDEEVYVVDGDEPGDGPDDHGDGEEDLDPEPEIPASLRQVIGKERKKPGPKKRALAEA